MITNQFNFWRNYDLYLSNNKNNLMNLDILRPRIKVEDLLPSLSTNCDKLIKQTHTKLQRALKFDLPNQGKLSFKPCIFLGVDFKCMTGLTS